jgi:hypothetical protein
MMVTKHPLFSDVPAQLGAVLERLEGAPSVPGSGDAPAPPEARAPLESTMARAGKILAEYRALHAQFEGLLARVATLDMAGLRHRSGLKALGNAAADATQLRSDIAAGLRQLGDLPSLSDALTVPQVEAGDLDYFTMVVEAHKVQPVRILSAIGGLAERLSAFLAMQLH